MSNCNSIFSLKEVILGLIPVTHRFMVGTEFIQCLKEVHIVLSDSIKRTINVYKNLILYPASIKCLKGLQATSSHM